MPKQEDRVKEGRSRLNLIIDDDQLAAIDGIAEIEGTSRSHIVSYLISDGLHKRGYFKEVRHYPDFVKYWLDCMTARPKGAFYDEPSELHVNYDDDREDEFPVCAYPDEHTVEDIQCATDFCDAEKRSILAVQGEIEEITQKYESLFRQIKEDFRKEREAYERKQKMLARTTGTLESKTQVKGKPARGKQKG